MTKNLGIITEPKSIRINIPIKINESLEHDNKIIVNCNEYLVNIQKKRLANYCSNMGMNIKKELSSLLESLN